MKALMEILMKPKSKLIILTVSVALLLIVITIFVTVKYRDNVNKNQQIKTEQANKIIEAKRVDDKVIEDKRIEDKKIADKSTKDKVEAQRIADKKTADEKAELTSIANEKLRIAKLNTGITLTKALEIGENLYPTYKLESLNNGSQIIDGMEFYVFKLFDLDWNDVGSDYYFCIKKTTGEAYRYYSNNTLMIDDATVTSTPDPAVSESTVNNEMTLEQAKAIGNNLRGEAIDSNTQLLPVYDDTVVINGGDFYVFEIYNQYASDGNEGVSWRLCISKASGKAFKQLPDKTLRDYK